MSVNRQRRADAVRSIARFTSRFLKRGQRVGVYLAAGSELGLDEIINMALWRGCEVYFPVIPLRARRLWFARLGAKSFWYRHSHFSVMECDGPVLRAERLDVLFVPLLGVDAEGYRMGQGGGFYDTTLQFRRRHALYGKPTLVGVAFDCQRVGQVPREPWDIKLDYLVTESGLIRF